MLTCMYNVCSFSSQFQPPCSVHLSRFSGFTSHREASPSLQLKDAPPPLAMWVLSSPPCLTQHITRVKLPCPLLPPLPHHQVLRPDGKLDLEMSHVCLNVTQKNKSCTRWTDGDVVRSCVSELKILIYLNKVNVALQHFDVHWKTLVYGSKVKRKKLYK